MLSHMQYLWGSNCSAAPAEYSVHQELKILNFPNIIIFVSFLDEVETPFNKVPQAATKISPIKTSDKLVLQY